jgi:hypothetical protein
LSGASSGFGHDTLVVLAGQFGQGFPTPPSNVGWIWEPVLSPPAPENGLFGLCILPADGNRAAYVGTRDFGTSPIFVQLSDKPLLASV